MISIIVLFTVFFINRSMAGDLCVKPQCTVPLDFIILHPSTDPAAFFRCTYTGSSFVAILQHCPANTVFQFRQQACTEGNIWDNPCTTPVLPPHTVCSAPSCKQPLEIILLHPADSPARFYHCYQGTSVKITCTEGSWFDFQQQACVPPSQWTDVCDFDTSTTTPSPPIACGMPPACVKADLDVLHPVAEDPRSFYRCEPIAGGFAAMRRECPSEFLFGFQQQGCVWPNEWLDPCV